MLRARALTIAWDELCSLRGRLAAFAPSIDSCGGLVLSRPVSLKCFGHESTLPTARPFDRPPGCHPPLSGSGRPWRCIPAAPFATAADGPMPSPLQIAPGPSTPFPGPSTPDALRTARAIKRGVQISPKKLNLVAKLVRRMPLAEAFRQCDVIPKKAARLVREVLKSAAANAEHNHRLRRANLTVEECFVTKGTNLYRTWWHGRGKVGKRTRYYSHLTVVLREADEAGAGTGGGARVAKALMDRPRRQRAEAGA